MVEPGPAVRNAHRRQLLGITFKVRDIELIEPPRADRLNADRNVLEIFFALGRGDDDLGLIRDVAVLRSLHWSWRRRDVGRVGARRRRLAGRLRLRNSVPNAGVAIAVEARSPSVSARNERSVIANAPIRLCVSIATERLPIVNG